MMQRRAFIALGAATAAAAGPSSAAAFSRIVGANERIRVGLIGAGLRGRADAGSVGKTNNAEVAAVSDVYVPRREKGAAKFGPPAKPVKDYRQILDSKDIDAVIVAAPDHWHVQMTLEAVSAGKDVYVEKPVTHTIEEGSKLISGVEQSKQVVATGTQQRSWPHYLAAQKIVAGGELGHVGFAESYWYQNYSHLPEAVQRGLDETSIDPAQLDWAQWLGSAPKQPFDKVKYLYWRFFPDFGGGIFTDLMTHWIDVIQWYLDTPEPSVTQAIGATYKYTQFALPDTVTAGFQFGNHYTSAFSGSLTCGLEDGGIIFRGEKAMLKLTRGGFWMYEEPERFGAAKLPPPEKVGQRIEDGTVANVANWLDCIRTRQTPNANIHAGVQAARTSHMANVAMRERRILLKEI
ncbi:MAG TPA: Gfo/Idh/MocA family oxidoreductase [Bryobacteraceae bacterium]|jgi:predicted dehydrogenase|nr:Gfo/Idh/MocA family oxidoreductase [Bryobacteraceae bacterium]